MNKKYITGAGAAAVILLAAAVLNQNEKSRMEGPSLSAEAETEPMSLAGTMAETVEIASEAEGPEVCEITTAERAILDELWGAMEHHDYEAAAKILNGNEEQLQIFFYGTLAAEDWLYDGEQVTDAKHGTGLVFRRPTALYYGTIADGCPEGQGVMLQAVRMQAGRYDYSEGTWHEGKMNGEGISGYRYYEEPDEETLLEVKKEGTFRDNLMNGAVLYTSVNRAAEPSQWRLEAADGVTVLGEEWIYLEDKGEYQLLAEGDEMHGYVLPEKLEGEVVWKNLLVWE